MWAANIGAHRTGQSSLDFRLRDASHIRNQILKLLKSVEESIGSAQELLFELPDSDEETFSDDDSDDEDEGPGSILEELLASLAATIKSLFQLSMLVRKPAQHDLYAGSSRADVTAFEPFYHGHVRDKFPNADESLISRLGSASARRKMYLKYRERHAAKLRQGINNIVTKTHGETNEGATTVMSDTVATDLLNWNIDFEESASNSGESQTSYAATLMRGGSLTIPPPPKESLEGNPFECPLCFHIVSIESTQSWNKHVFLDLQPYICLETGCKTPQTLYATRHDWLRHIKEDHPDNSNSSSISQEERKCPLCGEGSKNDMQLSKHSARHLQDLALFVLPQSLYGINEEEEDSGTQGSRVGNEADSSGESLVEESDEDREGWSSDDYMVGDRFIESKHISQRHQLNHDGKVLNTMNRFGTPTSGLKFDSFDHLNFYSNHNPPSKYSDDLLRKHQEGASQEEEPQSPLAQTITQSPRPEPTPSAEEDIHQQSPGARTKLADHSDLTTTKPEPLNKDEEPQSPSSQPYKESDWLSDLSAPRNQPNDSKYHYDPALEEWVQTKPNTSSTDQAKQAQSLQKDPSGQIGGCRKVLVWNHEAPDSFDRSATAYFRAKKGG